MNKEDTKKCIAVMQAYVDGEQIVDYGGNDVKDPYWQWHNDPDDYKVAAPKLKYRPFTAVEALDHIGEKVVLSEKEIEEIHSITKDSVVFIKWLGGSEESFEVDFIELLDMTFSNGTPCGVLVEEIE